MCVPSGARSRSWNAPHRPRGKISRPSRGRPAARSAAHDRQVGRHEHPAQPRSAAERAARSRSRSRSNSDRRRASAATRDDACRSSQTDSTGTNVLDRRYEAIIAKPTASASGTNSARAAPCMKNDGMNTARMQSIASSRGTAVSALPSRTARAIESVCAHLRVDVLDLDRRLVDQDADRQGQAAERHQVDRLAGEPQGHDRRHAAPAGCSARRRARSASRAGTRAPSGRSGPRRAPLRSARPRSARVTYGDWSNSKLTLMSSGSTACISGRACLIVVDHATASRRRPAWSPGCRRPAGR